MVCIDQFWYDTLIIVLSIVLMIIALPLGMFIYERFSDGREI